MRYSIAIVFMAALLVVGCNDGNGDPANTVGQGGSMSRFAISNSYLYVVDQMNIQVFNLATGNFSKINDVAIGFGLETIFARGEYLYLGARDAMYIYSIANPVAPSFIFRYQHITSCDPVVVSGNLAYVTLRSGSECNLGVNALEIIDISNPNNPRLLANYPMQSPHGLGIDGNFLFICEGSHGLKIFNAAVATQLKLITHLTNLDAFDGIARNGILTVTGKDGIFQYRYGDEMEGVELLSKIPVQRDDV